MCDGNTSFRSETKKRLYNGKLKLSKFLHQKFVMPKPQQQVIALILGCQRSGTTMLLNVFERDLRTKSYSENGWLGEYWPRMMPYQDIHQMLADDHVPLVIAKPLMESQRTLELLDEFPNAKAIWAHRVTQVLQTPGSRSSVRKYSLS